MLKAFVITGTDENLRRGVGFPLEGNQRESLFIEVLNYPTWTGLIPPFFCLVLGLPAYVVSRKLRRRSGLADMKKGEKERKRERVEEKKGGGVGEGGRAWMGKKDRGGGEDGRRVFLFFFFFFFWFFFFSFFFFRCSVF